MRWIGDFIYSLIVFVLALIGLFLHFFIIPVRVAWDMAGWSLKFALGEEWDKRPKWNWEQKP